MLKDNESGGHTPAPTTNPRKGPHPAVVVLVLLAAVLVAALFIGA